MALCRQTNTTPNSAPTALYSLSCTVERCQRRSSGSDHGRMGGKSKKHKPSITVHRCFQKKALKLLVLNLPALLSTCRLAQVPIYLNHGGYLQKQVRRLQSQKRKHSIRVKRWNKRNRQKTQSKFVIKTLSNHLLDHLLCRAVGFLFGLTEQ